MKKKLIVIAVVIIAIIVAIRFGVIPFPAHDPNEAMKKSAVQANPGEYYDIQYEHKQDLADSSEVRTFSFTADENSEYIFTTDNISGGDDVVMIMHILDDELSEYATVNNYKGVRNGGEPAESMETGVFLANEQTCYIVIEATSRAEEPGAFSGSYRFSVNKASEKKPEELKEGEHVKLIIAKEQQECAMFTPEETGYYEFVTRINSRNADTGFSSVEEVKADDQTEVMVTDGICSLEAGKQYYVWVSVNETTRKTRVDLSCNRMASVAFHGEGSVEIEGRTVIEYTPATTGPLMISSSSDGDPKSAVYDRDGFLVSADDNSGQGISENELDFALGLNAEGGGKYRICIDGKFSQCTVNIQKYTGDGETPME